MKILFVIRDMVVGGAGRQLALTANALSDKGFCVEIFAYCGGPLEHRLNCGVHFISQNPVPRGKITEYFLAPFNIRKRIKLSKPDIVISWRNNAGCFSVLASIGLKVKTIYSERTDPYSETSVALKISSWICGFSDGGIFQLERVRRYYKRLYDKSVVICNPVDSDMLKQNFIPYSEHRKNIVHVGRMVLSQKRQDVMIDAFKLFLEKFPNYELHFYGDGCDFEFVKQLAKDREIFDSVVFHGSVNDVTREIKDAKMLVLTSDYEGIPNVVLEAFSVGVPVVSTDCSPGGAKLLIGDDECGLLASVGNAYDVANKMMCVVENAENTELLISRGFSKLKDFSPEVIFSRLQKYLNLVGNR